MQFAQSPQQQDFPSSVFRLSLLFFRNQKSKVEGKKIELGFKTRFLRQCTLHSAPCLTTVSGPETALNSEIKFLTAQRPSSLNTIARKVLSAKYDHQPKRFLGASCSLGCNPSTFSSCAPSQDFKELSNKVFGSVPQQCTNTINAIARNTPGICHNHHKYWLCKKFSQMQKNCFAESVKFYT